MRQKRSQYFGAAKEGSNRTREIRETPLGRASAVPEDRAISLPVIPRVRRPKRTGSVVSGELKLACEVPVPKQAVSKAVRTVWWEISVDKKNLGDGG